jgi:2-dehydropantoate 2-reductase
MISVEKVSIIGAGAMGAFYASKFLDMDINCISLIAKGERANRLKEKGLVVNGKHYSVPPVRPGDKKPPSDLIIVAVKHHNLPEAIQDMKTSIGKNSLILSVMNGIESEGQIGAVHGMDKVLYAVSVGFNPAREGNSVTYAKQGKLFFGESENLVLSERVKRVKSLFDRAGIAHPFSVLQTSQEARELMESAMREVMTIAKAAKVHLLEEDLENCYASLSGQFPQGKTSMLQDVEAKRKTEVEMFAGKVTELGKTYGIPTPVNQTLFRLIKVIEQS